MEDIRPLDLVLFRGSDLISWIIREVQYIEFKMDNYSHVGVVVDNNILPNIPQLKSGRKYILESTLGEYIPDVLTGNIKFGVQIRDLEDVIRSYTLIPGSEVGYCRLKPYPLNVVDKMNEVIKEYADKFYETNPIRLLACVFPSLRWLRLVEDYIFIEGHRILSSIKAIDYNQNIDNISIKDAIRYVDNLSLFCSQLAVIVYQRLNLLPNTINPSDISPIQMIQFDIFEPIRYIKLDDCYFMIPLNNNDIAELVGVCKSI